MDEPRTCGEGLFQRADLPARVSALTAAMADVLEKHQQTLDLTDDNARTELAAYQQLAGDFRQLTSQLRATADHMIGCRDLPMARHDMQAMLAPEVRGALANLVERERVLAAFLNTWFKEDQAMLIALSESL
jgi:hypothetical protein